MSEIQEIDIFISPDGKVTIEVRGVKGSKCLKLTNNLEKALGGKIIIREYTDEFSQQDLDLEQSAFQGQN